jgi:P4 family phage/plasmid primase-like protien
MIDEQSRTDCATDFDALLGYESPLNRPAAITFFTDALAKSTDERPLSLRALATEIAATTGASKDSLPLLKLAKFGDATTAKGCLRHNANVTAITGIEADYDLGIMPVAEAAKLLRKADVAALIYTSPSHSASAPRWRVLCPTSGPLAPNDRDLLCARLNGALGGVLAAESFTLSQSFYYGHVNGREFFSELIDGRHIDKAGDLDAGALGKCGLAYSAVAKSPALPPLPLNSPDDDDDGFHREPDWPRIAAALAEISVETADAPEGRALWRDVGMALHHESSGSEAGFTAWDDWSKGGEKYDARDQRRTWQSFAGRTAKPVTIGTLYQLASRAQARAVATALGEHVGQGDTVATTLEAPEDDFMNAEPIGQGGDLANGDAFAAEYKGKLRYVPQWKAWLQWSNDGRWVRCNMGEQTEMAKLFARRNFRRACNAYADSPIKENDVRKKRADDLFSEGRKLEAMLRYAGSVKGVATPPDAFDANPWHLGVPGGLVDLKRGSFRAATPDDLISRRAGAAFVEGAACPHWDAFLMQVQPDVSIRAFIQRAVGYTITGSVSQEVAFFAHGSGANGKSVFANVLNRLMGDYAVTVGSRLLTKSRNGTDSESDRLVSSLIGKRLALANETGASEVWNDQRLKEIVSNEQISARRLYGEAFSFQPTHKIWIRGNHQPGAHDAGDGFWRRLVPVGFSVQIPESERVMDLDAKIIEAELSGVLNWAIAGCMAWQRDGLGVPAAIRGEVDRYRRDTDILGQWTESHCVRVAGQRLTVANAYRAYRHFCEAEGVTPPAKVAFGRQMRAKGFEQHPSTRERAYVDLALRHGFEGALDAMLGE